MGLTVLYGSRAVKNRWASGSPFATAAMTELAGVGLDVVGDLSLQRHREHLPGRVTNRLVESHPQVLIIAHA